jgi:hypothetical protein
MKTEELITLLVQSEPAVGRRAPARRFLWAVLAGLAAACVLAALFLGIRPDLLAALHLPLFWWKLAYAGTLAGAALVATARLARPGRQMGLAWLGLALPVALAAGAALAVLGLAPRDTWGALVLGSTWQVCPLLIALLAVPAFIGVFWALRGLAPTRLRLAGACGGLLAGAIATAAYCVHCPEMQVPFWATWYTLGMLLPAAAGAALGPRMLRW